MLLGFFSEGGIWRGKGCVLEGNVGGKLSPSNINLVTMRKGGGRKEQSVME